MGRDGGVPVRPPSELGVEQLPTTKHSCGGRLRTPCFAAGAGATSRSSERVRAPKSSTGAGRPADCSVKPSSETAKERSPKRTSVPGAKEETTELKENAIENEKETES